MISKERVLTAVSLKEPDRVPIGVPFTEFAARDAGFKIGECARDPEKHAKATIRFIKEYDFDVVLPGIGTYAFEAEALGSKTKNPEDGTPVIADHVVKEPKDIDKLRVPDPHKDGRLPYILKYQEIILNELGDSHFVVAFTTMPYSIAVGMRGFNKLIGDMKRAPELAHKILEIATETAINFGKAIRDLGVPFLYLTDAWASPPVLTHEWIHEFAAPYAARTIEALRPMPTNWCGVYGLSYLKEKWSTFLREILATGSAGTMALSPDSGSGGHVEKMPYDIDLKEWKKISTNHGDCMLAMVHSQTIRFGPNELIENDVKRLCQTLGPGGGFGIVANSIYPDTPPDNVKFFVECAKKYGTYPIST